jgi:uncharacterized membrane protein YdjX (TVP38/TMEM64 family)
MKTPSGAGIIFLTIFIILAALIAILLWPLIARLRLPGYREQFSAWIDTLGFKGVLIVFGIQILQIIVAVIPGGSVEILAGAAYGVLGGLAICILGCLAATTVIFLLVRKFGVPLVNRFFGPKLTGKYAFLKESIGFQDSRKVSLLLFLIFLIPGAPKDILTYIASLQDIKLSRFILITNVARTPAILMAVMLGSSMLQGNIVLIVVLFLIIAVTGILGLLYGEKIIRWFHSKS